jgi:flagellin-like protein
MLRVPLRARCDDVKKLFRGRRAVSPVIAAVLMIMVAIIGMSLLFAFFVNYTTDFQLGRGSSVLESFVIEDVWIKDSTTVEIWVYNVGKVELEISNFYVNDFLENVGNVDVEVGKHEKLSVELQRELKPNIVYVFKLVTARGSAVEGSYSWE